LNPSPGSSELIKVVYSVSSILAGGSSLTLGTQHGFRLLDSEIHKLNLNIGLVGSVPLLPPDGGALVQSDSPAFADAVLDLTWTSPSGSSRLSIDAGIRNENLLGARHLLSASGVRRSPLAEEHRAVLSPPPSKTMLANALSISSGAPPDL